MIALVMGTAVFVAAMQASISAPRAAFVSCLKDASSKAATAKVGADGFDGFVRSNCSSQATSLKGALVSFDVKNGVARKQASSDADLMIDDYLATSLDNYKARMPAAATAAPVAAAAPK
jgi:hypothetical protein